MKPLLPPLRRLLAAACGALASMTLTAAAAEEVKGWLFFADDLPGESTSPGHEEWLDLLALSAVGEGNTPATTIGVHRRVDKASPKLFLACAEGRVFPEVQLHVAKQENEQSLLFWSLTLKNVRVTSAQHGGSGGSTGAALEEDLILTHEGIRMTYYQLSDPAAPPLITVLPYTGDADGDGMSDAFETQFALLLHSDDAALDADRDGLTNLEESQLGTDPRNGSSFFKATVNPGPPGSNQLTLSWNSVPGASYRVRHSPNLAQPFEIIATITAAGDTSSHVVPTGSASGFYKIEKVEP